MNDLLLMDILQSTDNLMAVAFGLNLGDPLTPLDQLIQGLIGTDLKQDVNVF